MPESTIAIVGAFGVPLIQSTGAPVAHGQSWVLYVGSWKPDILTVSFGTIACARPIFATRRI